VQLLPPESPDAPPRRPRRRAIIGTLIGLALLGAAIVAIAMRREDLAGAFSALASAPWWMAPLALILPLANWSLVSWALYTITARHGPIRPGEMHALVAGAWLLNYLPFRPGMVGRIAYHKAVNGIPVKTSMGLLVLSMSLTAAAILILAALSLILRLADTLAAQGAIVAAGAGLLAAASLVLQRTGGPWRIATALTLRYLDMLVWVARYWLVFRLVGQHLTFEQACAIAAVSQAATAIPLSGNGLGLREWAVGLTAGALPAWFGPAIAAPPDTASTAAATTADPAAATAVAVLADLINRGLELAVAVPVGSVGMAEVTHRLRHLSDRDSANRLERTNMSETKRDVSGLAGPVESSILSPERNSNVQSDGGK
jgi:hypothetical protein